jgi:hypothetical protein
MVWLIYGVGVVTLSALRLRGPGSASAGRVSSDDGRRVLLSVTASNSLTIRSQLLSCVRRSIGPRLDADPPRAFLGPISFGRRQGADPPPRIERDDGQSPTRETADQRRCR